MSFSRRLFAHSAPLVEQRLAVNLHRLAAADHVAFASLVRCRRRWGTWVASPAVSSMCDGWVALDGSRCRGGVAVHGAGVRRFAEVGEHVGGAFAFCNFSEGVTMKAHVQWQ